MHLGEPGEEEEGDAEVQDDEENDELAEERKEEAAGVRVGGSPIESAALTSEGQRTEPSEDEEGDSPTEGVVNRPVGS